jgi:hypothetical protein
MALIATLRDDFTNNTVDPPWVTSVSGSATVAETGGQSRFTLPSSTAGSHDARYTSAARYNLTGDAASISIDTMVATGVAATAYFRMYLDANNYYEWTQTSGTLKARKIVAGVATDLYSVTWSATTYKYLRIRESGGTVFFDSSTSASGGGTWTNRGTTTIASAFAVDALQIVFGASCGNIASPGSFRLEDFNAILPLTAGTWRETTADWQISNRLRPITLAATANAQGVIVVADDMDSARLLSGNVRYFAGPLGSSSGGYLALTEYASLALAQASPFPIPVDGRVDLPALVDARFIRLYHRSTDGAAHTLREFVPRRMVQADDIEAESITAINIAAHTITADQIATINLDATATITAGAGVVTLDDQGIAIAVPNAFDDIYSYKFTSGGVSVGGLSAQISGSAPTVRLRAIPTTAVGDATMDVQSRVSTGYTATTSLLAVYNGTGYGLTITADSATKIIDTTGITDLNLNAATLKVGAGLNVGTATGAASGQISTSGSVGFGDAAQGNIRLYAKGQDATSSNYALYLNNSTPAAVFWVRNDGVMNVKSSIMINGTLVLGPRTTGWGTPTGTLYRTALTNASTQAQFNQAIMALINDLITQHGLIGA